MAFDGLAAPAGSADELLGAEVGHALDELFYPRHIRPAALVDEITAIPALGMLESGEFGRGVRRGVESGDAIGRRELRFGVLRGLCGHRRLCPATHPPKANPTIHVAATHPTQDQNQKPFDGR